MLFHSCISICRGRPESCCASSSKASREKLRRDRLNDKYSPAFYSPLLSLSCMHVHLSLTLNQSGMQLFMFYHD
jgi:hypothetical protein